MNCFVRLDVQCFETVVEMLKEQIQIKFFILRLKYASRGGCLRLTLAITVKVVRWSVMSHSIYRQKLHFLDHLNRYDLLEFVTLPLLLLEERLSICKRC